MTTKEDMASNTRLKPGVIKSALCGAAVGFICGFVGAGGGMMMLLLLTSVMGYELKTAVGTSVFIMTFTALTGCCFALWQWAACPICRRLCALHCVHAYLGESRCGIC